MGFALFAVAVLLFAAGVLICVAHDFPDAYESARRIFVALLFVLVLAVIVRVYAAEVQPLTCNDYDKYSAWWYLQLCFLGEHSS